MKIRKVQILQFLGLMVCLPSVAQLNCKTVKGLKDSTITSCQHANRTLSTREAWDGQKQWGKASCFDSKGNLLFEWHTRRVGGNASARLEYYKNGQVSKAELSSHPDGGIQRYNRTIHFNEAGGVTYDREDGTDNFGLPLNRPSLQNLGQPEKKDVVPQLNPQPERAVNNKSLYWSVLMIENQSHHPLVITSRKKTGTASIKKLTLAPGSLAPIDSVGRTDYFEEPDKSLAVTIERKNRRKRSNLLIRKELPVKLNRTKTIYKWVVSSS